MTANARLVQTIGKMDADNDNEAEIAFHAASRMLKASGLSWRDVAERMRGAAPTTATAAPATADGFASAFAGFGDIFAEMSARRRPEPPKPRKPRLEGADVPAQVAGAVRIDDRRAWRGGDMLVATVDGDAGICGPLVAFSSDVREELERAEREGLSVIARVRPPSQPGHMPVVVSATAVGGR